MLGQLRDGGNELQITKERVMLKGQQLKDKDEAKPGDTSTKRPREREEWDSDVPFYGD